MVSGSQKLISAAAPAHECVRSEHLGAGGGRAGSGGCSFRKGNSYWGWQRGHLAGALARGALCIRVPVGEWVLIYLRSHQESDRQWEVRAGVRFGG